MSLLNAIKSSLYLRNLFFSSGLYRAIPESMSDACFSLPYPVILWLYSWCDQNRQRGAQFRTSEFTRMCIQRCRATQTRMSMTHLALVCKCQPIKEWIQSLLEGNADFEQSLHLGPSPDHQGRTPLGTSHATDHLLSIVHAWSGLSVKQFALLSEIFLHSLSSITPIGLSALMLNYSALDELLICGKVQVCVSVCIHYAKFLHDITTTQM